MKLITRDTDYAIRALSCIAGEKKSMITVTTLAEKLDMPRPYLRKILQSLSKNNILNSSKGKGGGFFLKQDPKKISVLSLMEIFQGPFQLSEHLFKGKVCPRIKTCYLKKQLERIEKSVVQKLKTISIASIMKQSKD